MVETDGMAILQTESLTKSFGALTAVNGAGDQMDPTVTSIVLDSNDNDIYDALTASDRPSLSPADRTPGSA